MRWTLPNLLTTLRLLAAPLLALVFVLLPRPAADWVAVILFMAASATDWLDGYLARAWKQTSKMGAMLDPIADKAMVAIALLVLVAVSSFDTWLMLPAALILFREVFVSGLREYLGDTGGTLKVSNLAKWKTTVQMVAISVIFTHGIFEHAYGMAIWGMDDMLATQVLAGEVEDTQGLIWKANGTIWAGYLGLALLWLAAVLTLVTGWDYFRKALPHLQEDN